MSNGGAYCRIGQGLDPVPTRLLIGGLNGAKNRALTATPLPANTRGAKWTNVPLVALSQDYDPNAASVLTITDDGICYADNVETGEKTIVFIVPYYIGSRYVGGKIPTDLMHTTPSSSGFVEVIAWKQYALPTASGGKVLAWEAYSIG